MPSASPSPGKRPSLHERTASVQSLSSSGKPSTGPKQPRPHYVTRHSRNVSHGKGLSKLGKVNSSANISAEGRSHQRKKSSQATPQTSPKSGNSATLKRNSSHVVLPKNTSHANLRKNHSANALAVLNRNISHRALNKLGAPPNQKTQEQDHKQGVFDLGDESSGEDDEGDWEDSTTQSPELTRDNSKTSTPARVRTPNPDARQRLPDAPRSIMPEKSSSPPEPSPLKTNNRSAPNLRKDNIFSPENPVINPALLPQNGRASRAPPAMTTATAQGNAGMRRTDSTRSFTHISHQEAKSPTVSVTTPAVGQSSSGSAGVSHFLQSESLASTKRSDSDDESVSDFMSTYKPQESESPEKPRSLLNKARLPNVPSRTQQRLELQRREALRGVSSASTATPSAGMGLNVRSSASLHSRSGSKGRNRILSVEPRLTSQDYDAAVKALMVVRRFRNPVLESLHRLKETEILPSEIGSNPSAANKRSSQNKRSSAAPSQANGATKTPVGGSPDDKKSSGMAPRSGTRAESTRAVGRVSFQLSRQGSHDDIMTTSEGSPGMHHDEHEGISPEEALIRRMWESRVDVLA